MCLKIHRRLDRFMRDDRVKTGLFGLWLVAKAGTAAVAISAVYIIDAAVSHLDQRD